MGVISGQFAVQNRKKAGWFVPIYSISELLEDTGFVLAAIPPVTFVACFCQRTKYVQALSWNPSDFQPGEVTALKSCGHGLFLHSGDTLGGGNLSYRQVLQTTSHALCLREMLLEKLVENTFLGCYPILRLGWRHRPGNPLIVWLMGVNIRTS